MRSRIEEIEDKRGRGMGRNFQAGLTNGIFLTRRHGNTEWGFTDNYFAIVPGHYEQPSVT